jgi:outer membrane protein OmpA-like peptidoglycan-associated protein
MIGWVRGATCSGGEIMNIREWVMLVVTALVTPSLSHAQGTPCPTAPGGAKTRVPPDAFVTDLTMAPRDAILAEDIVEALAGPRCPWGQPPKVRLPLHFEFDSAELTPEARALLELVSAALQSPDLAPYRFEVEGHTDNAGPEDYNKWLSMERARGVAAYLEAKGVAEERLQPTGKGENSPVAPNNDTEGRQRNRRVDFINLGRYP